MTLAAVAMDTPTGRVAKWFGTRAPMTLAQAVEQGALAELKLRRGTIENALADLEFFGWLDIDAGVITFTAAGRRMLAPAIAADAAAVSALVPPRVVNRFTPPLSARYIPSPLGAREGSNDYRAIPSRHLPAADAVSPTPDKEKP